PHHLRFAQPRAIGLKVSDEFTVPLCRGHHRQLHQTGNEEAWWKGANIDVLKIAQDLWEQTHPESVRLADGGQAEEKKLAWRAMLSSVDVQHTVTPCLRHS